MIRLTLEEIDQKTISTIWKFPLEITDLQIIKWSGGGPLCVQVQDHQPCLWAMVDQNPMVEETARIIEMFGTGHPIPRGHLRRYIGTFQYGTLVFHVFERLGEGK